MAKYAPGDRVVVRKDLRTGVRYGMECGGHKWIAIEEMVELAGEVVTIKSVGPISAEGSYRIEEFECVWTDEMFSGFEWEVFSSPDNAVDDISEEDFLGLYN